MGKPYQSELVRLPEVYEWAMAADIKPLLQMVISFAPQPLLTIGSGGSLTAAASAAYLHQSYAQKLAHPVTPMHAVSVPALTDTGVLLTTGGGRNPDVLGCFRRVAEREPIQLGVICAAVNTPLADLVRSYWSARLFEFSPPTRKDGFIATNSLISSVVLLVRAYQEIFGDALLPSSWIDLWKESDAERAIEKSLDQIGDFDSLLVLYGLDGYPAALDLESKINETGLASIQLADYRNFAHGRHHGLKERAAQTAVLAIVTDSEREIARKTLELLPSTIRTSRLEVSANGTKAVVTALITIIKWVGALARRRQIDPGRPKVAQFGRKLYHLHSFKSADSRPSARNIAIERKANTSVRRLSASGSLQRWTDALDSTLDAYRRSKFGAIVFDYDGTLCAPASRYDGITTDMAKALTRLLRGGVYIGIATGRGKSVRDDLAARLPAKYWKQVWIGYYNGSQVAPLADQSKPAKAESIHASLQQVISDIESNVRLSALMTIDRSSSQITVFPKAFREDDVWQALLEICRKSDHSLVRSSHSFDVLLSGVSKLSVVDKMAELLGDSRHILRVGDLGRWPGNDHELLADQFGLSVDQVSMHPEQCWNFAAAGFRGTQATMQYLKALKLSPGGASLGLNTLRLLAQ